MRMKACAALGALLPAACTTHADGTRSVNKTAVGAGVGAVAGGVLGNRLDKDNRGRGTVIGAVAGTAAGAGLGYLMDRQEADLRQQLANERTDHAIELSVRDDLLKLTLANEISFDFGSAAIKPGFKPTMSKLAEVLRKYDRNEITIVGHTDAAGSGYNQTLSERRAMAVRDELNMLGVLSSRLQAVGRGEFEPRADNGTEAGQRQLNRRVEIPGAVHHLISPRPRSLGGRADLGPPFPQALRADRTPGAGASRARHPIPGPRWRRSSSRSAMPPSDWAPSRCSALSVAVGDADRICLVGRNGAGKSTLLKALAGLIELDRGERRQRARSAVAYLPQQPQLDPRLSALEATLCGQVPDQSELTAHRAAAVLDRFEIDPARRIAELSAGAVRRVDLARVLIGEPDVLLLDEPTNHLDLPTIERLEQDPPAGAAAWSWSATTAPLGAVSRSIWWLDRAGCARWIGALAHSRPGPSRSSRRRRPSCTSSTARSRSRPHGRIRASPPGAGAIRVGCGACRRSAPSGPATAPQGQVKLRAATEPAGGQLVIEALVVTKRFDDRTVVRDFSTRIMRGDRVGIVGPNGCGQDHAAAPADRRAGARCRHGPAWRQSCDQRDRPAPRRARSDATPWETPVPPAATTFRCRVAGST